MAQRRLIGFCNPLLDISGNVTDEFLRKYNLQANNAILAGPEHAHLASDLITVVADKVLYSAGGAGQNAMRAAQYLLPPRSVVFMGAVGKDQNASILKNSAEKDGLTTCYMEVEGHSTGTCVCLLTSGHRSLVASLNAACNFSLEHLHSSQNAQILSDAEAYYLSGFLFSSCPDLLFHVSEQARLNDKQVFMNLSAPFVCSVHFGDLCRVLRTKCSVLFGNDAEARAFAQSANFSSRDGDVKDIVKELAVFELSAGQERTVVITQGPNDTLWCDHRGTLFAFPVPAMPKEEIVDTNGAGDAFVGAFIASYLQSVDPLRNVEAGHSLAQLVIRQSGVVFPPKN